MLPHQHAGFISHIAIDIGGSLIKLVYFSPEDSAAEGGDDNRLVAESHGRCAHPFACHLLVTCLLLTRAGVRSNVGGVHPTPWAAMVALHCPEKAC